MSSLPQEASELGRASSRGWDRGGFYNPSAKCQVVAKPIVANNWKSYKAQKEALSQKYVQKKMFKTRQVTIFILSVTFLTILRFGATLCISKLTSYHPPILCEVLICSSIILYPCSKSFT